MIEDVNKLPKEAKSEAKPKSKPIREEPKEQSIQIIAEPIREQTKEPTVDLNSELTKQPAIESVCEETRELVNEPSRHQPSTNKPIELQSGLSTTSLVKRKYAEDYQLNEQQFKLIRDYFDRFQKDELISKSVFKTHLIHVLLMKNKVNQINFCFVFFFNYEILKNDLSGIG